MACSFMLKMSWAKRAKKRSDRNRLRMQCREKLWQKARESHGRMEMLRRPSEDLYDCTSQFSYKFARSSEIQAIKSPKKTDHRYPERNGLLCCLGVFNAT